MTKSGKYTFQNIEDPEVIVALRGMSRRWPRLAAAADHPLTEYFIHRRGRPGLITPLMHNARWIVYSILMASAYVVPQILVHKIPGGNVATGIFFYIISALILMSLVALLQRRPVIRAMSSPDQLISKDPAQNCWIWLSGLRYRDFLGIMVAYNYWLGSGLHRARYWICGIFTALNVIIILVLIKNGAGSAWIVNAIQLILMGIPFIFLLTDPAIQAYGSLRHAGIILGTRTDGYDMLVFYGLLPGIVTLAFAHGFPMLGLFMTFIMAGLIALVHKAMIDAFMRSIRTLRKKRREFMRLLAPEYAPVRKIR